MNSMILISQVSTLLTSQVIPDQRVSDSILFYTRLPTSKYIMLSPIPERYTRIEFTARTMIYSKLQYIKSTSEPFFTDYTVCHIIHEFKDVHKFENCLHHWCFNWYRLCSCCRIRTERWLQGLCWC